ncbi:MAG: (d)CMP kinase [Holosporaceae bacterium]|jgi:cytidylate kinase|nr:(d)CMP kinase [Holosporaceae bacterium]
MKPVVAIDGHACSGKGTLAKRLAKRFNLAYLDTGMLYRFIAIRKLGPAEIEKLSLEEAQRGLQKISAKDIRSDDVGAKASLIAKLPEVRMAMLQLQRGFMASPGEKYVGSILDGRDIGTVVALNATCKIFVTARLEVRAKRRFRWMRRYNPAITYDDVYENMRKRDLQDQSRDVAPLLCNASYSLIDTSDETVNQSLERIAGIVAAALATA